MEAGEFLILGQRGLQSKTLFRRHTTTTATTTTTSSSKAPVPVKTTLTKTDKPMAHAGGRNANYLRQDGDCTWVTQCRNSVFPPVLKEMVLNPGGTIMVQSASLAPALTHSLGEARSGPCGY